MSITMLGPTCPGVLALLAVEFKGPGPPAGPLIGPPVKLFAVCELALPTDLAFRYYADAIAVI